MNEKYIPKAMKITKRAKGYEELGGCKHPHSFPPFKKWLQIPAKESAYQRKKNSHHHESKWSTLLVCDFHPTYSLAHILIRISLNIPTPTWLLSLDWCARFLFPPAKQRPPDFEIGEASSTPWVSHEIRGRSGAARDGQCYGPLRELRGPGRWSRSRPDVWAPQVAPVPRFASTASRRVGPKSWSCSWRHVMGGELSAMPRLRGDLFLSLEEKKKKIQIFDG